MEEFAPVARQEKRDAQAAWRAICLLLAGGILLFGLWPFNPLPRNDVTWLGDRDGLRFGPTGVVLSSADVPFAAAPSSTGCAIEVWLLPGRTRNVSDILTFYSPDAPQRLRLFKWRESTLLLYRDYGGQHREIDVDDALHPGIPVLVTIVGGPEHTAIYLNGKLAQASTRRMVSPEDFSGQLILGTSSLTNTVWNGELRGLAMYGAELTSDEVAKHFAAWAGSAHPAFDSNETPLAMYTFSERRGSIIHDSLGTGPSLFIPPHFGVPHKSLLLPPWRDSQSSGWMGRDMLINIAGFVPVGFCFCAYFLLINPRGPAAMTVSILLGAGMSLAIEMLQFFLPSRTSSLTDLAMNSVGTALGVLLASIWFSPRISSLDLRLRKRITTKG